MIKMISGIMKSNRYFLTIFNALLVLLALDKHVNALIQHSYVGATTRTRIGGPINFISRRKSSHRGFTKSCLRKDNCIWRDYHNLARYTSQIQMRGWDGDDIRWISRIRRKLLRRRLRLDTSVRSQAKTALISIQIVLYAYQIVTTVINVRRKFPTYWPNHAAEMIVDSIWGSAILNGPLTNTFGFSSSFSKSEIPYRYITSGFFHSGLLHLLIDVGVLYRQPSWLSTGLGAPLYLTTFFGSIIMGNIAHVMNSTDRLFDVSMFLGSSGGICGLFGLMFVCLTRIANINPSNGGASSGQLFRGMAIMIILGLKMDNVNTAMNIGGFFGGIIIGILFGPLYKKDYAMRRKNSAGYDPVYRDYRTVMGFGIMPTESGLIPLKALYAMVIAVAISIKKYRNIPATVAKGLLNAL